MLLFPVFLRSTNRKKDHRCFSIVESRRAAGANTVRRTVLYLGEINGQQAAWRKTLEVFGATLHHHERSTVS